MLLHTKRQVEYTMRNLFVMFVTAVSIILFLFKLKWQKNKSFYKDPCFTYETQAKYVGKTKTQ